MMGLALQQARDAAASGEVPVGAVVARGAEVIAAAGNRKERDSDPTAHAEMIVLREAAALLGRWRLSDLVLYVTLEPCTMCMGAAIQARLDRIVFGCRDPRAGACGSVFEIARDPRLNHRIAVEEGVCASECAELLRSFFLPLRSKV